MREPSEYTVSTNDQQKVQPLLSTPLVIADHAGCKRRGQVTVLPELPTGDFDPPDEDEDFRIVVLLGPLKSRVSPGEGVVISSPARSLSSKGWKVRETKAPYRTSQEPDISLSASNTDLLAQGHFCAPAPLCVTPRDVFAEGKPRLTLLARDLLVSQALAEYQQALAIALAAPASPAAATRERFSELEDLIEGLSPEEGEVREAQDRLSETVYVEDSEELLTTVERLYPTKRPLMEDVYLIRAFQERPLEASELLQMQRFLLQAAVPADDTNLALDRSLIVKQLSAAVLVAEPQRMPPIRAMVQSFRAKYIAAYQKHHTNYWVGMARLHTRLREGRSQAEALHRLNTISELGPPVGVGALAAYEELVTKTAGCPLITGVEEMLDAEAVCPDCGLTMEQDAPGQRVEEILARIDRACERQRARLSSNAVRQVLHRSNDARVGQFLKMIQASQLSSLSEVITDELVGYLRRFLVESRIEDALRPILDQLQEGLSPTVNEAQGSMREITQVLNTAFRATHRALPPGEVREGKTPSRRKRKR